MKALWIMPALLVTSACMMTHERPQNAGEKTIVSDKVAYMVDAAGGTLDIRDTDGDVRCDRVKITGSHMVTRVCYTREEAEAISRRTEAVLQDDFIELPCFRNGVPCTAAGRN